MHASYIPSHPHTPTLPDCIESVAGSCGPLSPIMKWVQLILSPKCFKVCHSVVPTTGRSFALCASVWCCAAALPQTSTPAWPTPARTAQPAPPYAPTSPTQPPTAPQDAHAPALLPQAFTPTTQPAVWTPMRAATTHASRTAQAVRQLVLTSAAAPTVLQGASAPVRMAAFTVTLLDALSWVSEPRAGCGASSSSSGGCSNT
jgi:hypothetical protein